MRRLSVWAVAMMFLCGLSGVSLAGQSEAVPSFEDYPAQVYTGPVAAPDAADLNEDDDPAGVMEAFQENVFAGEYAIYWRSCGSGGCYYSALYSRRTGKLLTSFMSSAVIDYGTMMRVGEEVTEYRADSRLLITDGVPEGQESKGLNHTRYYVLDDGELKLIRVVKTPLEEGDFERPAQ